MPKTKKVAKSVTKSVGMAVVIVACVMVVKAFSYELERRNKRLVRDFSGYHRISPYNDCTC